MSGPAGTFMPEAPEKRHAGGFEPAIIGGRARARFEAAAASRPLGRFAPVLPVLVIFLVITRLLESIPLALALMALVAVCSAPGIVMYRWLREGADPLELSTGGTAFGLVVTTLTVVAFDAAGVRAVLPAVASCAVLAAVLALLRSRRRTARPIRASHAPEVLARSWIALAAIIALVGAMYLPPALSAAAPAPDGGIGFVKNFGFDYLRHLANTAAAVRGPLPPNNYFVYGIKVKDYWLYYPAPALLGRALEGEAELGRILLSYNFLIISLVLGYLLARVGKLWGGALPAALTVFLFWAASSLRGVAQLVPALRAMLEHEEKFVFTVPLFFAIFMGHHLLAILLFLIAITLYRPGAPGSGSRTIAPAVATGLLIPITALVSPFIGVIAGAWFVLLTGWTLATRRTRRQRVVRQAALAVFPGAAGLGLYILFFGAGFHPSSGFGRELSFDTHLTGLASNLVICMAPMLFLAGIGIVSRRLRAQSSVSILCVVAACLVSMSCLMVREPSIETTAHEVATKAGMVLTVALTFFAAAGIARLLRARRGDAGWMRYSTAAVAILLATGGLASSAAYVKTYSDLTTARTITAGDYKAALWIRDNTLKDAKFIVDSSNDYGPKNYSFLPPIAERQVYRGAKGISFRETTVTNGTNALYHGREEIIRQWITKPSATEWYVFCGAGERMENPDAIAALDRMPDLLQEVYSEDGVKIYRVRREAAARRENR